MDKSVFGKILENMKTPIETKLVTTEKQRSSLALERNYHLAKWFSESFLAIEMTKTKVVINKPIYLGLLIWEIAKIVLYEYCHD